MIRRVSFVAIIALLVGFLVPSCGENIGPDDGSNSLFSNLKVRSDLPPSPVGERDNPMLTYIQDNWTDGDQTSTAGLHFDHIKICGWMFRSLTDEDEAEFIVDHFDAYIWGGF